MPLFFDAKSLGIFLVFALTIDKLSFAKTLLAFGTHDSDHYVAFSQ